MLFLAGFRDQFEEEHTFHLCMIMYAEHRSYILASFSRIECLVTLGMMGIVIRNVPHLQLLICRFGILDLLVSNKVFQCLPFSISKEWLLILNFVKLVL